MRGSHRKVHSYPARSNFPWRASTSNLTCHRRMVSLTKRRRFDESVAMFNVSTPIRVTGRQAAQRQLSRSEKLRRRNGVHDLTTSSESIAEKSPEAASPCRSCGACCSFSRDWPRFTTENDSDLDRIPRRFADHHLGRMQCEGDRCAALVGEVGISTSCAVYSVRPEVCRACEPGDEACQLARYRFDL